MSFQNKFSDLVKISLLLFVLIDKFFVFYRIQYYFDDVRN